MPIVELKQYYSVLLSCVTTPLHKKPKSKKQQISSNKDEDTITNKFTQYVEADIKEAKTRKYRDNTYDNLSTKYKKLSSTENINDFDKNHKQKYRNRRITQMIHLILKKMSQVQVTVKIILMKKQDIKMKNQ